MMIDFKITDGKWDFSGGNIQFVDGAERVRQQLELRLSLWRGEWFLDSEFGTPYQQSILGKALTLEGALAAIRAEILKVEGVQTITSFDYDYDRKSRKLSVNFDCSTNYGKVTYGI